jgi:hypothetical protein
MASKFYFKPFVTVLVAPIITSIFIHFMFHIHCIAIYKLLYFSFFSASFCISVHWYQHIHHCACFLSYVFKYYILPICCNVSVCTPRFYRTVTFSCSHTGLCVCVCLCVHARARVRACVRATCLSIWCAKTLSCLIMYSFFAKMKHPWVRWSIVSSCCSHNQHLLSISSFKILFLR